MQKFEPGKDRWKLGFKEAVLANFVFLRSNAFKAVTEDVTLVRYESKAVFVNVYHGRGSYEIGVEIGRIDRSQKYGLDYIVSWAGKDAWDAEGFGRSTMFQVSTKEGVENIVAKLARIVQKYGQPFLGGDTAFYDQLERANECASMKFQRDQVVGQIRKEAEAAWLAKDYVRVTELFQPVRDELTEIDRKKLEYAEKHSGPPVPSTGGKTFKRR